MGAFPVQMEVGIDRGQYSHEFEALVDTGAIDTSLPASVLDEMGVKRTRKERFRTEDGETQELHMGQAWVRVNGRETPTWIIFAEEGSPVLLGRLTLDKLVLRVDSQSGRLAESILYR